jgi:glycosyltransferase involved in cell wall biosynthesis
MAERRKLALTYHYSENWIAGSYYVINIIKALDSLADEEKPELIILLKNQKGNHLFRGVDYPYIRLVNTNLNEDGFLVGWLRKLSLKLSGKDYYLRYRLSGVKDIFEGNDQFWFIKNHYYWVHDFQELRLPDFFTPEEAAARSALPKKVSQLGSAVLILSSYDALNDFKTFFPGYTCRVSTLRFASSLPDFSAVDLNRQLELFDIKQPYFICSNQFWQHKNHRLVLEAVCRLKEKGHLYQVVFTGKNYDHRNAGYFESLKVFVSEHGLQPWIRFCGFLDREVQLCLASHSIGYIQPSLFEGWSTTVEDAKYLNKHVLLSDISVHREQLDYNVTFFDPRDAGDLAKKMEMIIESPPATEKRDYRDNINVFGRDLINCFFQNEQH